MAKNIALDLLIRAKDQASAALSRLRSNLSGTADDVDKIGQSSSRVGALIAKLGVALAATGFVRFVKQSIDSADALSKLSQRTGIAVEELAGLRLAADLNDTSLDSVGNAVNRLSRFMAQNAEAAQQMGLSARDPIEALIQFADIYKNANSEQERALIGNQALGRSYADLAPLLLQGSDALREQINAGREANGVTQEQAEQAAEFNDELTKLTTGIQGFLQGAILPVLKPLGDLVNFFKSFASESKSAGAAVSESNPAWTIAAKTIGFLALKYEQLGRGIDATVAKLNALKNFDLSAIDAIDQAFNEDNAKALERYNKLLDDLSKPREAKTDTAINTGQAETEIRKVTTALDVALDKFKAWGGESGNATEKVSENLRRLSDRDLTELKQVLTDTFGAGVERIDELTAALDAIQTEEVTRAWRTLGQTSEQSLNAAAAAARNAFITIRDSGTASSTDLIKAWDAYIRKVQDAEQAVSAADAAELRRKQNLQALDEIGLEPEQKAARQKEQLAQETAEFQRLMDQGRFEEARRIAEQTEQLAFEVAKSEKQAYLDGQVLAFDATRAREQYMAAIENTQKALEELSAREKASLSDTGTSEINTQQQALAGLENQLDTLKEPVTITLNGDFSQILSQISEVRAQLAKLNSYNLAVNANVSSNVSAMGDIAREALMRGRR